MSLLSTLKSLFASAPRATPTEAAARVRAGTAVLVDVREPGEWAGGVADTAALLPLSDLRGARTRWKPFLDQLAGREIIVYCASGLRSGLAAKLLVSEGHRATNAGGLAGWANSGWSIVSPSAKIYPARKKGTP